MTSSAEKVSRHTMFVSSPRIEQDSKGKARLCSDISCKGRWSGESIYTRKFWTELDAPAETKPVYFETDKDFADFLCHERSDAFLVGLLPWAMRTGQDIECEAPVTEELLHNINNMLIPAIAKHDLKLHRIKVTAPTDSTPFGGKEVGTGLSLGVDSLYTVNQMINSEYEISKLTHLMYTSSKGNLEEGKVPNHESFERREEAQEVADALGVPLVFIDSNFRLQFPVSHRHAAPYTNLSAVFALRKLWRAYFFATTHEIAKFSVVNSSTVSADHYLSLLTHSFTTPGLSFYPSDLHAARPEKVAVIAGCNIAQRYLRVCLLKPKNCNTSGKCSRTLLDLDMHGHLDKFRESFDVDYYLENKVWYLRRFYLYPNDLFLGPAREHFLRTEPELMKQAQELAEEELKEKKKRKQSERIKRQRQKIKDQEQEIARLKQELAQSEPLIKKLTPKRITRRLKRTLRWHTN